MIQGTVLLSDDSLTLFTAEVGVVRSFGSWLAAVNGILVAVPSYQRRANRVTSITHRVPMLPLSFWKEYVQCCDDSVSLGARDLFAPQYPSKTRGDISSSDAPVRFGSVLHLILANRNLNRIGETVRFGYGSDDIGSVQFGSVRIGSDRFIIASTLLP